MVVEVLLLGRRWRWLRRWSRRGEGISALARLKGRRREVRVWPRGEEERRAGGVGPRLRQRSEARVRVGVGRERE